MKISVLFYTISRSIWKQIQTRKKLIIMFYLIFSTIRKNAHGYRSITPNISNKIMYPRTYLINEFNGLRHRYSNSIILSPLLHQNNEPKVINLPCRNKSYGWFVILWSWRLREHSSLFNKIFTIAKYIITILYKNAKKVLDWSKIIYFK